MKSKSPPFELDTLLTRLGFVRIPADSPHRVYRHEKTDSVFLLAAQDNERTWYGTMRAIRTTAIGRGVSSEQKFDALVHDLMCPYLNQQRTQPPRARAV